MAMAIWLIGYHHLIMSALAILLSHNYNDDDNDRGKNITDDDDDDDDKETSKIDDRLLPHLSVSCQTPHGRR